MKAPIGHRVTCASELRGSDARDAPDGLAAPLAGSHQGRPAAKMPEPRRHTRRVMRPTISRHIRHPNGARYFPLFLGSSAETGAASPARIYASEGEARAVAHSALEKGGYESRLIGRVAGPAVKLLPSTIYWSVRIARHPLAANLLSPKDGPQGSICEGSLRGRLVWRCQRGGQVIEQLSANVVHNVAAQLL